MRGIGVQRAALTRWTAKGVYRSVRVSRVGSSPPAAIRGHRARGAEAGRTLHRFFTRTIQSCNQPGNINIAGLNSTAFAGYTDWRLPNVKELQSIVNYENVIPAVSPAFNTGCEPACTGD